MTTLPLHRALTALFLLSVLLACEQVAVTVVAQLTATPPTPVPVTPALPTPTPAPGVDVGTVTNVVDGDTIDVNINGQVLRVRYIGINTPETDEPCAAGATAANASLVQGQTVRLVRDVSEVDRFGRLLRYVYVGERFVNAELVSQGYAEVVSYPPDTAFYDTFYTLELQAASSNVGCHPTGIFNDGTYAR